MPIFTAMRLLQSLLTCVNLFKITFFGLRVFLHASLRFQLENTFSFVFIYTLLIFQNNLVPAVFENRRDGTGRWIIIISSFDQCIYDTLLHFYATWYYRKKDLLKIFYNFHCNVVRDYEIACWKSSYD